jgi:hypothetical protein
MSLKDDCFKLRLDGKSFREISKIVKVPLSTVFLWTKRVKQTESQMVAIRKKSLNRLQESRIIAQKIKKENYENINKINRSLGLAMIDKIDHQNINAIVAALYWGEGFKKDRRLGLANSDSQIIRLFIYWLINIAKVPIEQIRLRVGINIIFKNNIEKINDYWSKITNIPLFQFQKPFYQNTKITRLYPNTENYHGVLRVRANGQNDVFQRLLGMVEKLKLETNRLDISDMD